MDVSWFLIAALAANNTLVFVEPPETGSPQPSCEQGACTVTYLPSFFDQYAPVTALDMVNNLPGFVLDNGSDSRGFAESAGNLLVDGERVSSKSERPGDVLSRIPAASVERIEIIRGQTGGTDLRGQTVIANVILKPGAFSGAWQVGGNTFSPDGGFYPFGSASAVFERGGTKMTVGLEASRYLGLVERDEKVFGSSGVITESRDEVFKEDGHDAKLTFQAEGSVSSTIFRLNASYSLFDEAGGETSLRTPVNGPSFTLFQGDTDEEEAFEIGVDVQRPFGSLVDAKVIGLFRQEDFRETGSLEFVDQGLVDSQTNFESLDTEAIVRVEIDFKAIDGHLLKAAFEGAINTLDSEFTLLQDFNGALVLQDVPGAETKVEEERFDLSLSDSFAMGPVAVDLVLAGEMSRITQTGGFEEEREFSFFKPGVTFVYAPSEQTQWLFTVRREVGQLNFFDFVSAADLGDDELSLGNPSLSPQTTIAVEAGFERRFGPLGVVTLTGFHDEISDVEDVLPLEDNLEVPGNIGDGSRSGLRSEATLPLGGLGILGGRLDFSGEWQTSTVTDPLTGDDRRLSGERRWESNVAFRQDLVARNLAWGTDISVFDNSVEFGLDEVDVFRSGADLDAFVETRAVKGLRITVGLENILGKGTNRRRDVFVSNRATNPIQFTERREDQNPRQLFLEVNGAF